MFPIEAFHATLEKAVCIFRHLGIRFHLTGGIASIYYGEPRLTQDIDIVIDNAQVTAALDSFLQALKNRISSTSPIRCEMPSQSKVCFSCSTVSNR